MNYLSYSLWGNNPLYNVGAIRNSEQVKNVYPNWKMILYYDNSVPSETIESLIKNDVICLDMSNSNIHGSFWRFLASDLEDAEYVCFRDCDSRLSEREFLAVQEWIDSKKTLHVMRDHPAHVIPYGINEPGILAGMWGIKSKTIPMTDLVSKFNQGKTLTYGHDQIFSKTIYQIFLNDRCTHDEFYEKKPFPIKRENGRFVGERIDINEKPVTEDYKILL
jgi:hypothetical protein